MSGIEADAAASGNQTFTFTGAAAFTSAGQIRFVQNGTDGCLQGDVSRQGGGTPFLKQSAPENGRVQRRPVSGKNDHAVPGHDRT